MADARVSRYRAENDAETHSVIGRLSTSMQAQFFSNIIHLTVVFLALVTASGLLAGITMAHITGNPPRRLPWPVEVDIDVEVVVKADSEE